MAVIAADYFTDPICSWSWGNEPNFRKLRQAFPGAIRIHHRMGGLVERRDEGFYDPQYDLGGENPEAYAIHQEEVSIETGMPIDTGVWKVHPPFSSHPACIAVKAVGLQGEELEDAYVRRVREGFFTERRPADTIASLMALAAEVPGVDLPRLAEEIEGPLAKEAFGDDFEAARHPVPQAKDTKMMEGRIRYGFPAMILMNETHGVRVLDGDSPWPDYVAAVQALAPSLSPAPPPDVAAFLHAVGRAATKEVEIVCELSRDEAKGQLEKLEKDGEIISRPVGHCCFWSVKGQASRTHGR